MTKQQATDHCDSEGLTQFGAVTRTHCERNGPQYRRDRGHQNRSKPDPCRGVDRCCSADPGAALPRDREEAPRYGNDDDRPEWREGTGIDSAINRCIDEVNRGKTRVGEVDSVNRDDGGWRVTGTTTGNGNFSCTIDRDGRIRNLNVDGQAI